MGRRVPLPLLLVAALVASLLVVAAPAPPALAQAPAAGVYMPLSPARILDTRQAGAGGPIASNTSRDIQVTGLGGVPTTDVLAVVLDMTVLNNVFDGWGLVWQAGTTRPAPASSINYLSGAAVTAAATSRVSADGKVSYYSAGATDLILDVVGYYRSSPGGGGYVPVTQTRILDSRITGKIVGGTPVDRKLRGVAGVPDTTAVTAVAFNITTLNQDATAYLTVYPRGQARPATSAMNYTAGRTQTQLVVATLASDGWASVYSPTGTAMLFDVVGYYTAGSGARYLPLTPSRVIDTRYDVPGWGVGPITGPLGANTSTAIKLTGAGGVPETGVSTVLVTAIAKGTTGGGSLSFWASGDPQPATTSLTYYTDQYTANLVMAKIGTDGKAMVTNFSGSTTSLVLDVVATSAPTRPPTR